MSDPAARRARMFQLAVAIISLGCLIGGPSLHALYGTSYSSVAALAAVGGASLVALLAWNMSKREAAASVDESPRATDRARRIFAVVRLVVPRRIADEELGDAMEEIAALARGRRPPWQIDLKVATTILWVLLHAARDLGRARAAGSPSKRGRTSK